MKHYYKAGGVTRHTVPLRYALIPYESQQVHYVSIDKAPNKLICMLN